MTDILWEDYIKPPMQGADDNEIVALETFIGIKLPEDYVEVLKKHQGQSPVNNIVCNDELEGVPFGPLLHADGDENHEKYIYSIQYNWKKWSKAYPNLVPFAGTGGGASRYAFDFNDHLNPCVVFIDADLPPDDPDSVFFVADSFSSLLSCLQKE